MAEKPARSVILCGAAGRDFHNFNVLFRDDPSKRVAAFTAAQIPDIENRRYPPELAGPLYPEGIPVYAEDRLPHLIREHGVDTVVFAYSDVPHRHVMHVGSLAMAAGADFVLLSPERTMLKARVPVVSVCAVRTGCGKSQTTRAVAERLERRGRRVVVVRHPMPYGDLRSQRVQRFASARDFGRHRCTIEEMEEYEAHVGQGRVVYAGIDYQAILEQAQEEADVLLWDGGNNDTPFYRPDLEIVVADPLRAGHELLYHPGETNFLRAHVIVINKIGSASDDEIERLQTNIGLYNPAAEVIRANSRLIVDRPELIRDRRVLVVEDGPTVTHGEMSYGAGYVAAREHGAGMIVDPRPWLAGTLVDVFRRYRHIGPVLPAMGYGEQQKKDLERTIGSVPCDAVVVATPVDLARVITLDRPVARVTYELEEVGEPRLEEVLFRQAAIRGTGRQP